MAKYTSGERTLEKYKVFPYIAWALVIGFALFVVHLTIQVKEAADGFRYTDVNHSAQSASRDRN